MNGWRDEEREEYAKMILEASIAGEDKEGYIDRQTFI